MNKKGVTLIELVTTILIVAILAGATAGIIVSLTQFFVYIPREIETKTIAHDIIETIAEGEPQRLGARYAVEIRDASATQFTYTFGYPANEDKRDMRFRWDARDDRIYRSYTAFGNGTQRPQPPYGAEEAIPYYAVGEVSVTGRQSSPNTIFTYFKADGSAWTRGSDPLNEIRRVEINIAVSTGTGEFAKAEAVFETTSGVEIKQYQ